MGRIELPTYSTIIPNEIFERRIGSLRVLDEEVEVTQLARLARFKVPTQDDVINFIKASANDASANQPLQLLLCLLPNSETKKIAESNEYSLGHFRNHCPNNLEEGSNYLEVLNGTVPTEVLDRAKIARLSGFNGENELYYSIIKKLGRDEWTLRIKLEDGILPEISELEYLLDRKVRDSNILYIEGASRHYSDAANHARLLYNVENSIGQIRDSSRQFLNQRACLTVKGAVACITTNDIIKKGLIIPVIQGHKEPYEGAYNN
ncbi:hypothetical protein A3K64_01705 [Candidatus Micrarchaeota archaeon RBG_16_36_9]|nr:MAG: hypothetical protein A3K64_01705 [Candidatus Micrarchaeota archaeon RBG_16_36_9]